MFFYPLRLLEFKQKIYLLILIFLMIIISLLELIGIGSVPIFIMTLIDDSKSIEYFNINTSFFENYSDNQILLAFAIFIFLIFLIKNIFFILTNILQFFFLKNFVTKLSNNIFSNYIKKNYQFHLYTNPAYILRNVTTETDSTKLYLLAMINMLRDLILIIFVTIFLLFYNFYITIISISFMIVSSILYYTFFVRKLDLIGKKNLEVKADLIKSINNSLWLIKLIKLHNKTEFFLNKFYNVIKLRYYIDALVAIFKSLNKPFIEITGITLIVLIIIIAASINLKDQLFILLATYAVALSRIGPLFGSINASMNAIKFYKPSLKVIMDILNNSEIDIVKKNYYFNDTISLKNISFSYQNSKIVTIENINLDIKKNDIIGIYGETGSGKSTILNLLLGLIKPTLGKIYLNGNEIKDNEDYLLSNAGYIPQDNLLVDDKIINNIAIGSETNDIDYEKINKVINQAQLNKFIDNLPDGLDTIVGDRGIRLSGGQIQRISIARALYFDTEILILDEATSALDNDTEMEFINSVEALKNKKTIIIVSHRKSIMKLCNKIFHLKDKFLSYEGNFLDFENKNTI